MSFTKGNVKEATMEKLTVIVYMSANKKTNKIVVATGPALHLYANNYRIQDLYRE